MNPPQMGFPKWGSFIPPTINYGVGKPNTRSTTKITIPIIQPLMLNIPNYPIKAKDKLKAEMSRT